MNSKPSNDDLYTNLARAYADAIDVPRYNYVAIEQRSPRATAASRASWRQYVFAAVAGIALVAWAAPALPALIADVQSAVQLFLERNGQMTPATDHEVTIEEAARELPFHVVPPSGVPIATPPMIRVMSIPGDSTSAQLMVQYASHLPGPKPGFTAMPALTIIESAASSPQRNFAITVHPANLPPLAPAPGKVRPYAERIVALTQTWVANGTRITLLGTPGAITEAQLTAVRHAMGG